jgi:hypothetical protein
MAAHPGFWGAAFLSRALFHLTPALWEREPRGKLQHPRAKHQRRSKLQPPKTRHIRALLLGSWSFSGAWMLVLGTFASQTIPLKTPRNPTTPSLHFSNPPPTDGLSTCNFQLSTFNSQPTPSYALATSTLAVAEPHLFYRRCLFLAAGRPMGGKENSGSRPIHQPIKAGGRPA